MRAQLRVIPETPQTSRHYHTKGFKGVPLHKETKNWQQSKSGNQVFFFYYIKNSLSQKTKHIDKDKDNNNLSLSNLSTGQYIREPTAAAAIVFLFFIKIKKGEYLVASFFPDNSIKT